MIRKIISSLVLITLFFQITGINNVFAQNGDSITIVELENISDENSELKNNDSGLLENEEIETSEEINTEEQVSENTENISETETEVLDENLENKTEDVSENLELENNDSEILKNEETETSEEINSEEQVSENTENISETETEVLDENLENEPEVMAGPAKQPEEDFDFSILSRSANDANTSRIDLAITSSKFDYYIGETVNSRILMDLSGNKTYENIKLKLTVPKACVQAPTVGASSLASSQTSSDDSENFYRIYNIKSISGGSAMNPDLRFIARNDVTSCDTTIKLEVLDENNVVLAETSKRYTFKSNPFEFEHGAMRRSDLSNIHITGQTPKEKETIDGNTVYTSTVKVSEDSNTIPEGTTAIYSMGLKTDGNIGAYTPSRVRIEYSIPEGASLKREYITLYTPDGVFVRNSNNNIFSINPNWTYDSEKNILVYNGTLSSNYTLVQLDFGGLPWDTVFETKAKIILDPGTEKEKVLPEISEYVKFKKLYEEYVFKPSDVAFYKNYSNNYRIYNKGNTTVFDYYLSLSLRNKEAKIKVKEFSDLDLDPRLYIESIMFDGAAINREIIEKGFKIIGLKDGQEKIIFEGDNTNAKTYIKIVFGRETDDYEKIIIRLNEPIEFNKDSGRPWIYINAKLRSEAHKEIKEEDLADTENYNKTLIRFGNRGAIKYTQVDGTGETEYVLPTLTYIPLVGESKRVTSYVNDNKNVTVNYGLGPNSNNVIYNSTNYFFQNLAPISEKNPASNYVVKNAKYMVLLPNGIDYVDGSTNSDWSKDVVIIENYKNTGKTAVIFSAGDIVRKNDNLSNNFKVDVKIYAEEGNNILEHYLIWDNNDEYVPKNYSGGKQLYKDVLDLDDDGDTEEYFLREETIINFIPPRDLVVRKTAGLDKNNFSIISPVSDLDSDVYYKISFDNKTEIMLNGLSLIDVLPYVGDHMITENEDGEYLPRESEYEIKLAGPLEDLPENAHLLTDWEFLYSTDSQGADLASVRNANFVPKEQITDFADVKMFKIILKQGKVIPGESNISFLVHGKTPKNIDSEKNILKSYNTVAFSRDNVNYVEGQEVQIPLITKYEIKGHAFMDYNEDGIYTEGEKLLAGRIIWLVDANDESIKIANTITNENGEYRFEVTKKGEYTVLVERYNPKEQATKLYEKNGKRIIGFGNDFITGESSEFISEKIVLTAENYSVTRNAGFKLSSGLVKVKKLDENGNPLSGVKFYLEKDGQKINTTKSTDLKGIALFEDLEIGDYKLVEEETLPGYAKKTEKIDVTISEDTLYKEVEVTNEKQKWNIKIVKEAKENSDKKLSGATFELQDKTGKVVATGTTNNLGELIFENIFYGEYVLVEKTAPVGYRKGENIQIGTDFFDTTKIELSKTVQNELLASNLNFTLVDYESNATKISGATFEIQKADGTVVATKTTDENGNFTVENLERGNYKIVQKSTALGYLVNNFEPEISENSFTGNDINITGKNVKKVWKIKLVKYDEKDETKKLSGATFEINLRDLYTQREENFNYHNTSNTLQPYTGSNPEGKERNELLNDFYPGYIRTDVRRTTDVNGEAIFNGVILGNYTLTEIKAPDGYKTLENPITISENMFSNDSDEILIEVGNEIQIKNIVVDVYKRYHGYRSINENEEIVQEYLEEEEPMSSMVLELQDRDGKVIATKTTDDNGRAIFENIPAGDYVVVQKTPVNGFIESTVGGKDGKGRALTSNILKNSFNIVDDNIERDIINYADIFTLGILLLDKDDETKVLKGEFELVDKDGYILRAGPMYDISYDEKDELDILSAVGYVEYTDLYLRQTKFPEGYKENPEIIFIPASTYDKDYSELVEKYNIDFGRLIRFEEDYYGIFIVKNEKQLWDLKVTKYDENDETKKLAGAIFELQDEKGNVIKAAQTTNQAGETIFKDLEYKVYQIVEKDSPAGYKKVTTPTIVTLNKFDKNQKEIEVSISNEKQYWNLEVTKVAKEDKTKKLSGAIFELHDLAGKALFEAKTTDETGKILFENVEYGEYRLVEKDSPTSYKILDEAIKILPSSFDKNSEKISIEVENEKQLWDLRIILSDKDDEKIKIKGAKFELRDEKGNTIRTVEVTDDAGEVLFEKLLYGNYILVETEATPEYKDNTTPMNISENIFNKRLSEVKYEVKNEKEKWNLKVVKTGYAGGKLEGVRFELQNDKSEKIFEASTNEAGEILIENLEYGEYKLVETEALPGYKLISPIFITENRFDKKQLLITENVKNELSGGSAVVPTISNNSNVKTNTEAPTPAKTSPITVKEEAKVVVVEEKEEVVIVKEKVEEKIEPKTEIKINNEQLNLIKEKLKNRELPKDFEAVAPMEPSKGYSEFVKYPTLIPKTGTEGFEEAIKKGGAIAAAASSIIETKLPNKEIFDLAGSGETNLNVWLEKLVKEDRNADKYLVLPSRGLVMPINTVEKEAKEYKLFANGINQDFAKELRTGAVELPATSTRGYGEVGNKVIGGHSSYFKNALGRYKTHFQKIIGMETEEEIWIYEKNENGTFSRYVYKVTESYNTDANDISVLKPTDKAQLTLFTCTPIGGVSGRWIVKSEFVGVY